MPPLPNDGLQPWEALDSAGHVIADSRQSSSLNAASEFLAGIERFTEGGTVSDLGEASRLSSGSQGGKALSWATYRLPLAGQQPGALALDVNLQQKSGAPSGTLSSYYLGVSNYTAGVWEWYGPFADSHVRLGRVAGATADPQRLLGPANYLSPLGNLFVTVLAYDGAAVDVVGLGVNPLDGSDSTAPAAPAALAATAHEGALLLEWTPVIATDLAGYRIYSSSSPFSSTTESGVSSLPALVGTSSQLLVTNVQRHLRVSAVDISGNESALSPSATAVPLGGAVPAFTVSTDSTGGPLNSAASLTVSSPTAGLQYEYDLDGDGIFDFGPTPVTTQTIDTSAPGIIRPAVRALGNGGAAVALGSVSLLISANSRPAVLATASPTSGTAPLLVNLDGEAEDSDGSIVEYAWDYTADGIFDFTSGASPATTRNYTAAGVKNAKLRATDDAGDWAVDSIVIVVEAAAGGTGPVASFSADPPEGELGATVYFDAAASSPGSGSITKYEWDLNADGTYETDTGAISNTQKAYSTVGNKHVKLRITTSTAAIAEAELLVTIHGWSEPLAIDDSTTQTQSCSMCLVQGFPAIAYYQSPLDNILRYVRALDEDGKNWGSPVTIDPNGVTGWFISMDIVRGRPAVSYYDPSSQTLYYCRANDAIGSSWGARKQVDNAVASGQHTSLEMVNGRPAISYYLNGLDNLYYVRATDATGGAWGTPELVEATNDVGEYSSLAVVAGRPAIACFDGSANDLLYFRATDVDGTAWGGAQIIDGAAAEIAGKFCTLKVANGVPCIGYQYHQSMDMRFVRALDPEGLNWVTPPTVLDALDSAGWDATMAIVGGNPMTAFNNGLGDLAVCQSFDPAGNAWTQPVVIDEQADSGKYNSACEVNGYLAIAYFDMSGGPSKLKFIRQY